MGLREPNDAPLEGAALDDQITELFAYGVLILFAATAAIALFALAAHWARGAA